VLRNFVSPLSAVWSGASAENDSSIYTTAAGFSTELNLQDDMTFKLKYLDVSVQNLVVMQYK